MENASKALLIAGGVLITVIVLSLLVSLYMLFSKQSKQYADIMDQTEINKFNSNFDVYIGRTDITAQEVITVYNLGKKYNVSISKPSTGEVETKVTSESFLKTYIDKKFQCNSDDVEYDDYGKITSMKFILNLY